MKNVGFDLEFEGDTIIAVSPVDQPELTVMVNDCVKNESSTFVPSGTKGWVQAITLQQSGGYGRLYLGIRFSSYPGAIALVMFEELNQNSIRQNNSIRLMASRKAS
jgi:hypothetical protein